MKAKKSLGQNFLRHDPTLDAIVRETFPNVPVLEVGPGTGNLTRKLLEAGHQVIAIEKDDRLIAPLEIEFQSQIKTGQFRLVHGDALLDSPALLGLEQFQVVANLPYYITGLYLRRTLESDHQPQQMILLLQEEVVDRIVARDNKESVLSISVKIYGEARKLVRVSKKYFSPQPKIDSAVLQVFNITKDRLRGIDEADFFAVVKQGFSSKRKTLANNLKSHEGIKDKIKLIGLDERIRPERLSVEDWVELVCIL